MDNKLLIGIAGGTAAGKSAIARHLLNHFKPNTCAVIKVDSYEETFQYIQNSADLRNLYNPEQMKEKKLKYYSVGRPDIN